MKRHLHKHLSSLLILAGTLLLAACSGQAPCDGSCARLNPAPEETSVPCKKLKVYLENSLSMDGYLKEHTLFKTNLQNITFAAVRATEAGSTELFYRNSLVRPFKGNIKDFVKNATNADLFPKGSLGTTNTEEIMRDVIAGTKAGEVTVFFSDCVYSPPKTDSSVVNNLDLLRGAMQRAIGDKLKADPTFSVLLYRFTSTFDGKYWDINDHDVDLTGKERPYFVWVFGRREHLSKIYREMAEENRERVGSKAPLQCYAAFATVPVRAEIGTGDVYERCDSSRWHIAAVENREQLGFSLSVDLTSLPVSPDMLLDTASYDIKGPLNPRLTRIKATQTAAGRKQTFSHRFSVTLGKHNGGNKIPAASRLTLTLRRPPLPGWVEKCNDPTGEDILSGQPVKRTDRTFGLLPLVKGVQGAYGETPYVNIQLQIL